MHRPSRRTLAIVAAVASLTTGSLATTAQLAAASSDPFPIQPRALLDGLLDGLLGGILDSVMSSTIPQLQALLAPLTGEQTGDLLAAADSAQLTKLLSALNTAQLTGALGTLTPTELNSVVDGMSAGQTGDVLGSANPAQLTALLGALTGGQLTGALATLLPAELTSLLGTATAALVGAAPGPARDALQDLIDRLTPLVPLTPPGTTPPGTTPPATTPPATTPAGTTPARTTPGAAKANTRYRARISNMRVSKTRRSAALRLTCPASAPKGCIVKVNGQVAGRRAAKGKWVLLVRNTSKTVTMKLTSATTKRLRTKGGPVRLSAKTYLTSMGTVSKTVRVKRPRKR